MEELEAIDINQMLNQLQVQAQVFEHSRMNLQKQYQTMEQSLLDAEIRNPLQEQMQLFEYLYIELQKRFWALEQLRLKTEALSPMQLKEQATQLKLMQDLKLELEQLKKLMLQIKRLGTRLSVHLIAFMLVQLPIHILLRLLSLILLPLIIRASKSLPEEATADLAALRQRLKRSRKNPAYIQLRTAWHVLEILWAFYIKIKIDNLRLPKKSSTR